MAASSAAGDCRWLAVIVRNNNRTISNTAVKTSSGDKLSDLYSGSESVKFYGFRNNPIPEGSGGNVELGPGMLVEGDAPIEAIWGFNIKYVLVVEHIEDPKLKADPDSKPQSQSALDVLMLMTKKRSAHSNLPPQRKEVNNRDKVFNMVLDMLKNQGVGFQSSQIEAKNAIGRRIVDSLEDTLWFLDSHREKFENRSIKLPYNEFKGFNDYRSKHTKAPMISAEALKGHIDTWSDLALHPVFTVPVIKPLYEDITKLLTGMKKYHTFLTDQQGRTMANHSHDVSCKSLKDDWVLRHIDALHGPVSVAYLKVEEALLDTEFYEPLALSDFEPVDRYERRKWLQNMKLPFQTTMIQFNYGNYIGNMNFVWRTPAEGREDNKTVSAITAVKKLLPFYNNRFVRRMFIDRYSQVTTAKPAVLRSILNFISDNASSGDHATDRIIEQRVEEIIETEDVDLLLDYRSNNGKVSDPKLEPFWNELTIYLDEKSAVHERRSTDTLYLPFAISVNNLRDEIEKRLPKDTPLPSISTLKFQFWPHNPFAKSALAYTGRFNVRFRVQQRLLHSQHVDSPFCAYQWHMLKQMAVNWRSNTTMISVDDKAVIPIGEPSLAMSTGVRAKCKSLTSKDSSTLLAGDHDFHVAGAVPSVLFDLVIPESVKDSFYKGEIHVTLKDKVFEASSPMRHCAEVVNILRDKYSSDGLNLDKPILLVYSDGGPDHRTTFISVKLAAVMMFIAFDLDLLVLCRTAPSQSYANPAERTMSVLNLALQNVALRRDDMADYELRFKSLSSLIKFRRAAENDVTIKTKFKESVAPVLNLLNQRFAALKWQENAINTHTPASESEIELISSLIGIIDNDCADASKIKSLENHPRIKEFFEKHTRSRHYNFQVKKCTDFATCGYCRLNEPRLENFEELHFLPDPVLDRDGKYKEFQDVYGTETVDSARPGLLLKPQPTEYDKKNKKVLVAEKARMTIKCCECGKPRVVYSAKRINLNEQNMLLRLEEECYYVCGTRLFNGQSLSDVLIVREGINCQAAIETSYYAGKSTLFPDVCFHCGDQEIYNGPEVAEKRHLFGIVRPICHACLTCGKGIITRNALKVGMKKRK